MKTLMSFILSASLVTVWFNDENKLRERWHKMKSGDGKYTSYLGPFYKNQYFSYGVGTNECLVELGFRSDGVVVWRKVEEGKDK